jgi:diguanylate cyclase (GGDEF)-like protein/PAS domain S-box-containing protein
VDVPARPVTTTRSSLTEHGSRGVHEVVIQIDTVSDQDRWPAVAPLVLQRAVTAAAQGITIADASDPDFPLVYVNPAFSRLTGYAPAEALGRNCRVLQGPDTDADAVATLHEALHAAREATAVLLNYRRDGTPFWNEVGLSPVRDDAGRLTHFIGYQVDVTDRVERERALAARAHADPLTGLSNRDHLLEQLDRRLSAADGCPTLAVVHVDLEEFHRINETFDYEVGNLVLCAVAERLTQLAQPGDLLARLDADGFVLVRDATATGRAAAIAAATVEQVQRALTAPITTPAVPIPVQAHCGFAVSPGDGTTAAALLRAARRALQRRRALT